MHRSHLALLAYAALLALMVTPTFGIGDPVGDYWDCADEVAYTLGTDLQTGQTLCFVDTERDGEELMYIFAANPMTCLGFAQSIPTSGVLGLGCGIGNPGVRCNKNRTCSTTWPECFSLMRCRWVGDNQLPDCPPAVDLPPPYETREELAAARARVQSVIVGMPWADTEKLTVLLYVDSLDSEWVRLIDETYDAEYYARLLGTAVLALDGSASSSHLTTPGPTPRQ